ncbi:hypothetical protein P9112_007405 [Eukaryota sp. TZLM1-RC]
MISLVNQLSRLLAPVQCNVILLGHRSSGKSLFLQRLKHPSRPPSQTTPSYGLNIHVLPLSSSKLSLRLWDLPGDPSYIETWENYSSKSHGAVFFISFSQSPKSLDLFHHLLPRLQQCPIAILISSNDSMNQEDFLSFSEIILNCLFDSPHTGPVAVFNLNFGADAAELTERINEVVHFFETKFTVQCRIIDD